MDSFSKFLKRSGEIKNLEKMVKELNPPMRKKQRDRMSVLTRASIVMLCSHIEGYLEDIVIEFIDKMCKESVSMGKVPGKLKVAHMKKDIENIQYTEEKIKKLFTNYSKLWIDGETLEKGDLDGERIVKGFSTPGTQEVNELMERLGISKVMEYPKLNLVKSDMDAIVKRRNDIAHGMLEAEVSFDDLIRYNKTALKFAKSIDKIVTKHLKQI